MVFVTSWLLPFMTICHNMEISTHLETVYVTKIVFIFAAQRVYIVHYLPAGLKLEKSRDFCLSEKQLCLKFDFNHKIELFPSLFSQVQAWISYSLWDMNNWTYYFNFANGCGGPLMLTERYWKLTEWHLYANKWSSSYISVDWTTAPDFFVIKRITKLDRSYISADPMAELHHAVSKVIKKTFFNSLLFFRLSKKYDKISNK